MKYTFKVYKDKKLGYWTECLEQDNLHTQGDNFCDLLNNIKEVIELINGDTNATVVLQNE